MALSSDLPDIFRRICERGDRDILFGKDAAERLAADPECAAVLEELRRKSHPPETQLLLLLKTLAQHDVLAEARQNGISLVVTDPSIANSGARFTESVVEEMCEAARHEVFVAGYAIAASGGLDAHLAKAAARGCRIVVVAGAWGKGQKGTGVNAILSSWPGHLPRPECYAHQPGASRAMHVKALITDSADMLVGSANFTFSAVKSNFELGIRVKGTAAANARKFLETVSHSPDFVRMA